MSDLSLTETAEFWRTAPEVVRGDVRPEDIQTEVFFFPCAAHTEKDGSFTNPRPRSSRSAREWVRRR